MENLENWRYSPSCYYKKYNPLPSSTSRDIFNRLLTTIGNQPLTLITLNFKSIAEKVTLEFVKKKWNSYLSNIKKLFTKFKWKYRVFEQGKSNNYHIHYLIEEVDLELLLIIIPYYWPHGAAHISPNNGFYEDNTDLFLYLTKSIWKPSKTQYHFSRKPYSKYQSRSQTSKEFRSFRKINQQSYPFISTCDDSCINTCCRQSCVYSTCICAQHQTNCQWNHGHSPPH